MPRQVLRRRRRWPWVLVVGAMVAMVAVLAARQTGLWVDGAEALVPETDGPAAKVTSGPNADQFHDSARQRQLALAQGTGFDIVVEPAGALVSLDDREIGAAPLRVRNVEPGEHVISVAPPPGYFAHHTRIALGPGQSETIRISLTKVTDEQARASEDTSQPSAKATRDQRVGRRAKRSGGRPKTDVAGGTGTMMIGSKPPCEIVIDGKNTGLTTPQRAIELSAGRHEVALINAKEGIAKRFRVNVVADKVTRVLQDYTDELPSHR